MPARPCLPGFPEGPCPPRTLGTHLQKALGARQVISPILEAKKLRLKKVE